MSVEQINWKARVDQARNEADRRALLAEVGRWRAARLTNLEAQREASFAIARLYAALGDNERALAEAKQLQNLSRDPRFASSWGRRSKRLMQRLSRPSTPASIDWSGFGRAVLEGDLKAARQFLGQRKGPRADRARLWLRVRDALEGSADDMSLFLRELEQELGEAFGPRKPAPAKATTKGEGKPSTERARKSEASDSPLAKWLGGSIPSRRRELVDALEKAVREHADKLDGLTAAALQHHLDTAGTRRTAPWLFGLTARTLAWSDAEQTHAVLAVAREQGAFAVTAYDEPGFKQVVALLKALQDNPDHLAQIRRGLGRGGVEAGRDTWTVRLGHGADQVQLAFLSEGAVQALADIVSRLQSIHPRTLLVLPAGSAIPADLPQGFLAVASDDAARWLEAAGEVPAAPVVEAEAPAAPTEQAAVADETPSAQDEPEAPARRREASPFARIAETLSGEAEPAIEELGEALKGLRRRFKAFASVRGALDNLPVEQADARMETFLRAVDLWAPEGMGFPQGTTLAVLQASLLPQGKVATFLGDSTRFGGAGVPVVLDVVKAASGAGYEVARVVRGATRKEQREHAALEHLADQTRGLWRLAVIRDGGVEGDVVVVADATPETRATLPLILLEERNRVVLLADDDGLRAWYGETGGPVPVLWDGPDDAPQLLDAIGQWA